jgi:hypothetical protein
MTTAKTSIKPLTPPDLKRCQAEKPGNGPFSMGGPIGNPLNGYRVRCDSKPKFIATENKPGDDGRVGSMSLCGSCKDVMLKQLPEGFCTLTPLNAHKPVARARKAGVR